MDYDRSVIVQFADRLYRRARSTVAFYTFLGIILGLFVGFGLAAMAKNPILIVAGIAIVGVLGFSFGTEKAFQFRLQAQQALCLAQIEANTRK